MPNSLQIATLSPGLLQTSIALATNRSGELALLDFEYVRNRAAVGEAIQWLNNTVRRPFGIKLDGDCPELLASVIADLPHQLRTIVLSSTCPQKLEHHVRLLQGKKITTLLEATCLENAKQGEAIGVDGLIAKGHEAGGRVADETTFILLQRFLAEVGVPVWAHGGIGLHTAAACAAAGAAGLVLDAQLWLARESSLPEAVRAKIARMDGSETICLGDQLGETYRIYFRPGHSVVAELQDLESRLAKAERAHGELRAEWREALVRRAGWHTEQNALLVGQDAAFAAPLADRFRTVAGILQGMRDAIRTHCQAAIRLRPLSEGSPLARSNATRYPILQGPMTRVSDVPEFAARVAEGGALPFLALALMRGPEVKVLLEEVQRRLGELPWGVGILGFVPPELRQEQMDVIQEYRPPFALIAGGRPDHARALEQKGISTYLHVPSPGLLRMFIQQGARRFVFEGRECGGHVGPRTSFVLWNQMVDELLSAPELASNAEEFHVVFAAGIHDALSAEMVSVIAAPLAEHGVRVGVLLGTAYLFTEEVVSSGAILQTFQEQALQCRNTVLLETGPGHSTRCVDTPYATTFANEKRRLVAAGRPPEETRLALEELNLGRLRIASKGVTRHSEFGRDPTAPKLIEVDKGEQVAQGMYMIGQVAALRNATCTVEELHRDVSVEGSNRLERLAGRAWLTSPTEVVECPSDVAIIGMACLLPKAPNLAAYWENILHKVDAISEIPKDRWDWELYFDSDPKAKDKIYSKWGGFLEDVPFDPVQYGMPPTSLRSIEPAQLLTLEIVRAALADAGYLARPFPRERTSVILGAGGGAADLGLGYGARSFIPVLENLPEFRGRSSNILDRLDGRLPEWTEDSFAGILTNVLAGRVANRFDLGGSNYTVDAACASSLAAVSLALRELEERNSDMVIVGGVDTMQNPFTYLCFSKTHALSPRGRCRAFDEGADGIAISEGIALIVLKRLADAERDGDHIYAVIRGAGSSSDGKDRGLTAPRPEGQVRALKRAYAKAGISPATVTLVEAHGTGTVAGDRAEVEALTEVFSEAKAPRQGCAIGSVKSMIGHTKCTAGAAGLMKAALALHYRVLPPTLGVEKPNQLARLSETPFFVNTEPRPWLESSNGHPRRAGVSAFGFGGTNFHVVLEEYVGDPFCPAPAPSQEWSDELFLWKADSRETLLRAVETWDKALATEARPALRDLACTAWKQAQEKPRENGSSQPQLAIVASSLDDLKKKLSLARQSLAQPETTEIKDPRGIYFSQQPLASRGKLAFLFPGQGSQYPRMLQDLLLYFPEMRRVFEWSERALGRKLAQPLRAYVFPPLPFSREEEQAQQKALTQTNVAQPALGAVDLAMFGLLQEFGLQPDMVAGHSYGEYVALAAAGVFGTEALIALSEARGRFIVEGAGAEPGVMAAIEAEASTVRDIVDNVDGVFLANANAPKQSVISGTRAAVQRVVEYCAAEGTAARMIPVACAFHSPLVAPAQARLAELLSTLEMAEPGITVYSNTTAEPYPKEPQAVRQQLVEHLVRPVEFMREIEAMYAAGARVFVEAGPRGVLTSLVEEILRDRPKLAVASNQSGRPGLSQLLHLIAQLAAQGYVLKLDRLYRDRSNRCLDLGKLERECAEKQLAPSVWMVNGARATPLKDVSTPSVRQPVTTVLAPTAQKQPVESSTPPSPTSVPTLPVVATTVPHSNGEPVLSSPSRVAPAPESNSSTSAAAVPTSAIPTSPVGSAVLPHSDSVPEMMMTQFQQMMTRFLDTQKTVMLAYLGAEPGATIPAASPVASVSKPAALSSDVEVRHEPSMIPGDLTVPHAADKPTMAAAPVGAVGAVGATDVATERVVRQPSATPTEPDKLELTARLLAIVSERTGYPPEMLDLNLDLESDLGIDSIKRVEILGTFQQTFAAGIRVEEGFMEKLNGVRTLQGIVDRVLEQMAKTESGPSVKLPERTTSEPAGAASDTLSSHAGAESVVRQPSAAPTEPDKQELTARLLAIVSERTGYPPEMLDLNLDLESDLGIDSIKRVEILGTFQQTFAAGIRVEEGFMEKLNGVRTLQGIVDRVLEQMAKTESGPSVKLPERTASEPAGPASTVSPSQNETGEEERIQRFTLTTVETPAVGRSKNIAKDRVILITDGGHAVTRALTDELLRRGYRVAVVRQDAGVREMGKGSYVADLGSLESVTELIALVNERDGQLGGIVHLLPLRGEANFTAHDYQSWRDQLRLGVRSLFHIAKAANQQLRQAAAEGGASLVAATGMGGAFLSVLPKHAPAKFPDHGAIVGFMKTLALEWPEISVKVVDVNPEEGGQILAGHLCDELHTTDDLVEIGYDEHRRITLKPVHVPLQPEEPANFVLDSSSVILITGGARGITSLAARRLAQLYKPTLVLVGRSPLPQPQEDPETAGITSPGALKEVLIKQMRARGETVTLGVVERAYARLGAEREVRSNLIALQHFGAQVHYHPVDVRDAESFGAFIEGVYKSFDRIDGVIHGAGVIEDKLIQDKTAESFDRVFDTKVDSAFVLSRKLRPENLKFLVFFSSISGRFGNRGQADYASANEVLNKLAICLSRAWPSRVVAMNWGPWETEGMVSAEVRKQFADRGVRLIAPEIGVRRLEEELSYGPPGDAEVIVGGAEWHSTPKREVSSGSRPLLGKAVFSQRETSLELVREFDPAHDLYLNDHRLDAQPVLPLAVATELMAETVAQGWPQMEVAGVRELHLLRGVVIESGTKKVRVLAKPLIAAKNPASFAVEIIGAVEPSRIHYRATVDLARRLPDAPALKLTPLTDGRPFSMNIEDVYRRRLFHGPLFQGICRVDLLGLSGITAFLGTSSPERWIAGAKPSQWLIDPLMFDSALQLLVLWAREHWDMTALPTGFHSYRRFAAPSTPRILCEVRLRPNTGAQTIHADFFFLDPNTGGVLGILEDMQGACSKALNRLADQKSLAAVGNMS